MSAVPAATDSARRPRVVPVRRIAVLRALQLGDLLCVVPALRALRAAQPHAHITLIGLPWAAGFVQRFSKYLDDHLAFPGMPGMPEQPACVDALPAFIAAAREQRFDLALQLHGSGILTNPLLQQLGAACNAGFYMPSHDCPDQERFLPWIEEEHEVLRALRLMQFLGMEAQGEALEFPLFDTDYQALRNCCGVLPAPGTYACIHPGARLPSRRWPPQRFAQVADYLAAAGLQIVLTGSAQERPLANAVKHAMQATAIDLSGKTELGALAALIANARIVVCNDTGISHIAAALAAPSVVICCGADPQRWMPLNRRRHRMVYHDIGCRPCMHFSCPIAHPCATGLAVGTVLTQVQQVLAAHGASEFARCHPQQMPATGGNRRLGI
jgi:ADP-heptose:LPS heptosyltransferase